MKSTRYLEPFALLGALGLSLAAAHGQASVSHASTTAMNNTGGNSGTAVFGISVKPGNAKWKQSAAVAGATSGPLGDGTLLDWQIHTAVNNESPFAGSTVSAGPGTYFDTPTCADSTVGGPQNYFDVWEANDIDEDASDIPNGTTPAVGNGPTPIHGNIDISGLTDGQIYVINGTWRASVRVNLTMTGPGKSPIVMPEYVAPYDASTNRMFLMEFTFNNPDGEYTNIEWSSNNGQNNTGRRRWGGIFLDGTLFVDTVEPTWEATYPNAAPVSDTLFFINGQTNEACTIYFVVLADGASAPSSAQVKAGTDASDTPVALSGDFAVAGLEVGTELITGLTASTSYDVYVVAEDVRGPNLQATPVLVDVTTTAPDVTPPGWTATYPQVSRTPAGLAGIANIDEAGTAYFVVLPSGATAPTSAQVKAGTDASDAVAPAGSVSGLSAGVDGSAIIGGLTVGTTYDVYFVAEDLGGNLQAAPQLVTSGPADAVDQFATGAIAWGTASVWSSVAGGPYTDPWGDGNNAVFEGGSGVVAIASGTTVGDITFNSNNWILQGGPLNLVGTTQPVINVNGNTPRLENSLAGTQGFVKAGTGILRLVGTNSITGGIVIDGGWLGDNGGAAGTATLNNNDITANAGAVGLTCGGGTVTDGGITINDTMLSISNNNSSITVNGPVTGTGGIALSKTGDGQNLVSLLSTANTFTGGVNYTSNRNIELNVNSFADSLDPGTGNIRFGLGNPATTSTRNRFALQSGATSPLTLTNRQFEIASGNNYPAQIYNNSEQAFTINSDLIVSGTGAKTLELGGTGAGTSTFAGDIGDGSGTLALTKSGSGTWMLSGDNTYTGATTVTGGTLALVGGSQKSAITVNSGATLGFTLGSPTTSTAAVTLNAGHKIAVTGTPNGVSDYPLMTASSISGAPVLDPPVPGYSIEVQGAGTQLVLVSSGPIATLVIDLGSGTVIEGGAFGTFGATNLPIPALPVGSILRSVSVNAAITATDNDNFASDLAILFDPTPATPGDDFSLRMTSGAITFGAANQLTWPSAAEAGPPTALVDTKNDPEWSAVGAIDLATYGIFLGNAFKKDGWVAGQGGTWSGTITLTYDLVSTGSPYATWAAINAPTGNPDDDYDGDGVSNGVEFVLGGDKNTNDLGALPVPANDGTDMTFTFVRDQASIDASTVVTIEVSTDLTDWSETYAVPDGAAANNPGVTVSQGVPAAGKDTVTLTVPASGAKKFARLKVVITL